MTQATLFANDMPRNTTCKALIEHFNLDIEIVDPSKSEIYQKEFPLHKTPAFISAEGEKLHEFIPLSMYLASQIKDDKVRVQLIGENSDYMKQAQIGKWLSLVNSDFFINVATIFYMALDRLPMEETAHARAWNEVKSVVNVFEERLKDNDYLVGNEITMADLDSVTIWVFSAQHVVGKELLNKYPHIEIWINRILNSPVLKGRFPDFKIRELNIDSK